jgi:hypothetical protein
MKDGFRLYFIGVIGGAGVTVLLFVIIRISEILPPKNNLLGFLLSLLGGVIVWAIGYYFIRSEKSSKRLEDIYESKADKIVVDKQIDELKKDVNYLNKYKANDSDIENIKFMIKELGLNYAYNQAEHQELSKSIKESYEKTQESIKGIYNILLRNSGIKTEKDENN